MKISIHALREEGDPEVRPLGRKRFGISIHALREEGDRLDNVLCGLLGLFLSTPSARRATASTQATGKTYTVFLSTPSARRATNFQTDYDKRVEFLSTPSARRATRGPEGSGGGLRISIHALREEGDLDSDLLISIEDDISIHALREEGDITLTAGSLTTSDFYPRPPRGGRPETVAMRLELSLFLSTPSARRATGQYEPFRAYAQISIHALREEGDRLSEYFSREGPDFYPRPPRGGRPGGYLITIYIFRNFYPRPPRGGRHLPPKYQAQAVKFLSTPSARRATGGVVDGVGPGGISIHALREEGDLIDRRVWGAGKISIHALREEGDTSPPRLTAW